MSSLWYSLTLMCESFARQLTKMVKFFDLFSMNMSSGYSLVRKEKGEKIDWRRKDSYFRLPTASISYFELEKLAAKLLSKSMEIQDEKD